MRHTYNEDVTYAREDSHNLHYVYFFCISKATALANQSLEDNTKLSLMLCSIFCMETSFLDKADVI